MANTRSVESFKYRYTVKLMNSILCQLIFRTALWHVENGACIFVINVKWNILSKQF